MTVVIRHFYRYRSYYLLTYSDGARCLKVGGRVHEKPNLPEAFHERRTREFGGDPVRRPSLPPRKIEFEIGGDAISRCLEGLTCTLQYLLLSRYSITFSIPRPTHPHYFYANLDKLRDPYSKKWKVRIPRPPVTPLHHCLLAVLLCYDVRSTFTM